MVERTWGSSTKKIPKKMTDGTQTGGKGNKDGRGQHALRTTHATSTGSSTTTREFFCYGISHTGDLF